MQTFCFRFDIFFIKYKSSGSVHSVKYLRKARTEFTVGGGGGDTEFLGQKGNNLLRRRKFFVPISKRFALIYMFLD
jgi:hypothetical protein